MKGSVRLLWIIWAAVLAVLVAAPSVAYATPNAPRAISNIAHAQWLQGARQVEQRSNRVDLWVDGVVPPLQTYRISASAGSAVTRSLEGATCNGSSGTVPFRFQGAWAATSLSAAPVTPTTSIRAGEPLIYGVEDKLSNRRPDAIDKVTVVIRTSAGDSEQVTLVETGPNTALFLGAIRTRATPPAPQPGDCILSLSPGSSLNLSAAESAGDPAFATAPLEVLIDPYGIAFDSGNGIGIPGTRISVVDAVSGELADVFGDDGISRYPNVVITGQTVVDEGGQVYKFAPGEYRFPLMRPGRYRLKVEPPSPYTVWSTRTPADLAGFSHSGGVPYTIADPSYGGIIELFDPDPVRVDIPMDHQPPSGILLTKTASQSVASAGDLVRYSIKLRNPDPTRVTGAITVVDMIPHQLRLRADTLRLDGAPITAFKMEGSRLTVTLPRLLGGASAILSYVLEVRGDAKEGDALNRASAKDAFGSVSNAADALVRITRDIIGHKVTIIGRVTEGLCDVGDSKGRGVPNVRVMLEDGSYAVTDHEGRYHFEGLSTGTHVVQLDTGSLSGRSVLDCDRTTRSAGNAFSRFAEGGGGSLKRVDFRVSSSSISASQAKPAQAKRNAVATNASAAGADRDWFAGQKPGVEWLFPEPDHNPRGPVVRVAIKHGPGQSVKLFVNRQPVHAVSFDGARTDRAKTMAVSLWRGISLRDRANTLSAQVYNADGSLAHTLERHAYFTSGAMQAQLVPEASVLVADGVTRPVIAVRMTDRSGRPVHHGMIGDFEVPAPYYPAVEASAQQERQLAGLERARPVWRAEGDSGIAYIELEPTTASGSVTLNFKFRDGRVVREQRVEAWLDPGERPWTIVGLATGTVGYNRVAGKVEALQKDGQDDVLTDGRLALYAKGRVLGKWLMTLAYDSDKKEDETRFSGIIDPQAYYTIYADRSERRYDAASVRRLYLRLERPQFYALFGDYVTGIVEPELARYVRSFNGLKAEYRSPQVSLNAFAADTPSRHRRDEIQGNGLSGPYALSARSILANSERIVLEVRDRERSNIVLETRLLTRHIDYDIDYETGIVRFREPILSRSLHLDPQFIVADYEVDGVADRAANAGGRLTWRTPDQKFQVGATAIHDEDGDRRTILGGADVRYRPTPDTEIRAELAFTDRNRDRLDSVSGNGAARAWQVEAEHHGETLDLLAYAREQQGGFGLGQQNNAERGTRKVGLDARVGLSPSLSLIGSMWHEDYLATDARRAAGRMLIEHRRDDLAARVGVTFADDRLATGESAQSTILQVGATKRFLDNRVEIDAQSEFPLGGRDESIDFPARHRLSGRYAVATGVHLVGAYEMARGEHIEARTARVGFELTPWAGARIALMGNSQYIDEYGPRSFAAYGLSQSLVLSKSWSVDFSLDGNKTLGGFDASRVLNPAHPVASGGFLHRTGLTEDFTAVTAGATYRAALWSINGRGEYRIGDRDTRYGITAAALRQLGEGSALGGAINYFVAEARDGPATQTLSAQLSWAHRPSSSAFSWLDKLELRRDGVKGAVLGEEGPLGLPLLIGGDASSTRLLNSLSINWSPRGRGNIFRASEIALFLGTRYVGEQLGADDIGGWSNVLGADVRFNITDKIDIGGSGSIRHGLDARSITYSAGPSIGITPFENGWMSVGWNIAGFNDRDFDEERYTRSGPYVTMSLKLDQNSFRGLGLGRR